MFINQFTLTAQHGRYNHYAHFIDEKAGAKTFISPASQRQKVVEEIQSSLSPDPELLNLFYCPLNFHSQIPAPQMNYI